MLLYDMGDPIRAVEILGPDIRSVHVKDARRPKVAGQWGEEVPLGEGEVDIKEFVLALKKIGYTGRSSSSARSAIKPADCVTSPAASISCETASRADTMAAIVIERCLARIEIPALSPRRRDCAIDAASGIGISDLADDRIHDLCELAPGIGQGVEIMLAGATRLDQPAMSQQREVVAHGGLALRA